MIIGCANKLSFILISGYLFINKKFLKVQQPSVIDILQFGTVSQEGSLFRKFQIIPYTRLDSAVTMLSNAFHKLVVSTIFNRFSRGEKQNKIIYIVERSMLKYVWETLS